MYKINELAELAGVSSRTLRYYDKIGLLSPSKVGDNGYRYYNSDNVDFLQQILFYKELGYSLDLIKNIMVDDDFNQLNSLYSQLLLLEKKQDKINNVIHLVKNTIDTIERGETMSDEKKFEALKKQQIYENQEKYGKELEKKYDSSFIDMTNQKYLKKSKYEMKVQDELTITLNETIKMAMETKDPTSKLAIKMCQLHKEWLCFYWPNYDENHHLALVEMYTQDDRFRQYYDKVSVGAADFLFEAMKLYISK